MDLITHGGQEWSSLSTFIEDLSVTTNFLGTPKPSLDKCKTALNLVHHYPPSDYGQTIQILSDYIVNDTCNNKNINNLQKRLLLGNGASELIDLAIRYLAKTQIIWKSGPFNPQYKEYERSALIEKGIRVDPSDNSANLLMIVNPCNPTGEFMNIDQMISYISSNTRSNSSVVVDESMLMWYGPNWRSQSLTSQFSFVRKMAVERCVHIFVIHSWTKIWACPGLRIGSLVAPSEELASDLRKRQIPWNMNIVALKFIESVVMDSDYMELTWAETTRLRKAAVQKFIDFNRNWTIHGKPWLSFIWIDTHNAAVAKMCYEVSKKFGVPIRWGGQGYDSETCIRVAVRQEKHIDQLLLAFKSIPCDLIESHKEVTIPHINH